MVELVNQAASWGIWVAMSVIWSPFAISIILIIVVIWFIWFIIKKN